MASEIIGLGPCINCDAQVEYRMNVAGRAFYRCLGSVDPDRRACGIEVKAFGKLDTDKLIKKLRKEKARGVESGSDAGKAGGKRKPEPEPGSEPEPERKSGDLAAQLIGR